MLESLLIGLGANAISKAFSIALAGLRQRRSGGLSGFVDRSLPNLRTGQRADLVAWLEEPPDSVWSSPDSLAAEFVSALGLEPALANESAKVLWGELLAEVRPADLVAIVNATQAAEAAAVGLEQVEWVSERLSLPESALLPFPMQSYHLSQPAFDPEEWVVPRAQMLAHAGDVCLVGLPSTGGLRFALTTAGMVFVEASASTLAHDLQTAAPEFVLPVFDDLDLVRELVRIRHVKSLAYRIVVLNHSSETFHALVDPLRVEIPTLSRRSLAPAVLSAGVSEPGVIDSVLEASAGRVDLALRLAEFGPSVSALQISNESARVLLDALPETLSAEVEAAIALVAAIQPVRDSDLPLIAQIAGLTTPALKRTIQSLAQVGLLDRRRSLDPSTLATTDSTAIAVRGVRDELLFRMWNEGHYGLFSSLVELGEVLPDYLFASFGIAAEAASRGLPVGGVDLEFAFADDALAAADHQQRLAVLAAVAQQSAQVASIVVERAVRMAKITSDLHPAAVDSLVDIAAVAVEFGLPEAWSLLLSIPSDDEGGHRRRSVEQVFFNPETSELRAERRRRALEACLRWLDDDGSDLGNSAALIEAAIALEHVQLARDLVDPIKVHRANRRIGLEEAEVIAEFLPSLAGACGAIESVGLPISWAMKLLGYATRRHESCCGRELEPAVVGTLTETAKQVLEGLPRQLITDPRMIERFNRASSLVDGVEPVELRLSDAAALIGYDESEDDSDPLLKEEIREDGTIELVEDPVVASRHAELRRQNLDRIDEWSASLAPLSISEALREVADAFEEARNAGSGYRAYEAVGRVYAALIRSVADPVEMFDLVAAEVPDHFPLDVLLVRLLSGQDAHAASRTVEKALSNPPIRLVLQRLALTDRLPDDVAAEVLRGPQPFDVRAIGHIGSDPRRIASRMELLLSNPEKVVRIAAALEFSPLEDDPWLKRPHIGGLSDTSAWQAATLEVCSDADVQTDFWERRLAQSVAVIAGTDPHAVVAWLVDRYLASPREGRFRGVLRAVLSSLPTQSKFDLLQAVDSSPALVVDMPYLVGEDVDFVREGIARGDLTSHDALNAVGLNPSPRRVLALAPALLSAGVEPRVLAARALSGVWSGSAVDHYGSLREGFEVETDAADEHVRAAARAGVAVCDEQIRAAAEWERQRETGESP